MKMAGIAVADDNSWVVIGISAVLGDVASLEYVENMISGCKDEWVSSTGPKIWTRHSISLPIWSAESKRDDLKSLIVNESMVEMGEVVPSTAFDYIFNTHWWYV